MSRRHVQSDAGGQGVRPLPPPCQPPRRWPPPGSIRMNVRHFLKLPPSRFAGDFTLRHQPAI